MKKRDSGSYRTIGSKISDDRGMTMAEMIAVVMIVIVLAGIAFISVWQYQRSLAQLERDKVAKEIFIAAQNHLTVVKGEGYLDSKSVTGGDSILIDFGTSDETSTVKNDDDVEVAIEDDYYVVYNGTVSIPDNNSTILSQMLPFGSIEETVRTGGSYIIHYQKSSGLVLDVFYCTRSGSTRFDYTLTSEDYDTVMGMRGPENKGARRDWEGHVLGWYGGPGAEGLPTTTLEAPEIKVINADRLFIKIKNKNFTSTGTPEGSIRIIIEGVLSGQIHYLNVDMTGTVHSDGKYKDYYEKDYILDEVTAKYEIGSSKTGGHFAERIFDDMTGAENGFIPGEDIKIKAVAYSNDSISNIAYSKEIVTNSLYASVANPSDSKAAPTTAYISSIRHLENLDRDISDLDKNDDNKLDITTGIQSRNLNWTEFRNNINSSGTVKVYKLVDSEGTKDNCYRPISLGAAFTYDGMRYSISNIKADKDNAGLIGTSSSVTIENLELIDFDITGSDAAGALAGSLTSSTVMNVLVRNSDDSDAAITSSGDAGGLIGNMVGGTVLYSAASVQVSAGASAGGLIGSSSGNVSGCYSGGHTEDGLYEKWIFTDYKKNGAEEKHDGSNKGFDVSGADAGGLIGHMTGGSVSKSYSTCSVSGTDKAGGFVGEKADGTVTGCYCTGLMDQSGEKKPNAFIGSGSLAANSGNYYLSTINEKETDPGKLLEYLEPGSESGVTAIDENTAAYEGFIGGERKLARPYDRKLKQYYNNRYGLVAVSQMGDKTIADDTPYSDWSELFVNTHYGDWPAPEIFFINKK